MSEWRQGISPSDLLRAREIAAAEGVGADYIGFHYDEAQDCWQLWYFPPEAIAAGARQIGTNESGLFEPWPGS